MAGVSLYRDCFYGNLYVTYKSHIFTLFPHDVEQLIICDLIFNVQITVYMALLAALALAVTQVISKAASLSCLSMNGVMVLVCYR
jgi:hypothetical protein